MSPVEEKSKKSKARGAHSTKSDKKRKRQQDEDFETPIAQEKKEKKRHRSNDDANPESQRAPDSKGADVSRPRKKKKKVSSVTGTELQSAAISTSELSQKSTSRKKQKSRPDVLEGNDMSAQEHSATDVVEPSPKHEKKKKKKKKERESRELEEDGLPEELQISSVNEAGLSLESDVEEIEHMAQEKQKKKKKRRKSVDEIESRLQRAPDAFKLSIKTSPFYTKTASFYLPIPPITQRYPLEAMCAEHFSPLIMTYYQPFHAFILTYRNPRWRQSDSQSGQNNEQGTSYCKSIDEYAAPYAWVTADFCIFKPQKGDVLLGQANLQNASSLGLLCWNYFSASIPSSQLPPGWKWSSGGGDVAQNPEQMEMQARLEADAPIEASEGDGDPPPPTDEVDEHGQFWDDMGDVVDGMFAFQVTSTEVSRSVEQDHSFLNVRGTMRKGSLRRAEKRLEDSQEGLGEVSPDANSTYRLSQQVDSFPVSKEKLKY